MSGSISLLAIDLLVSVLLDSLNLFPCPYIYVNYEQFSTIKYNQITQKSSARTFEGNQSDHDDVIMIMMLP